MNSVADRLKALRERARPKLTVRGLAEKLELPWSSYARYETASRYKKKHLPLELTRRLAAILVDHAIDSAEVMALAGVGSEEFTKPEFSAAEIELVERYRQLDPAYQRLVWQTLDTLIRPPEREPVSAPARPARRAENERPAGKSSKDRGMFL